MLSTVLFISLIALVVIATVILIVRKKKSSKKGEFERVSQSLESSLRDNLDESATDLVKKFLWYIVHEDSPFNRTQRRRIKRHYQKFLWIWTDLTKEQQDVETIVRYLVAAPINHFVVEGYLDLFKKEEDDK